MLAFAFCDIFINDLFLHVSDSFFVDVINNWKFNR